MSNVSREKIALVVFVGLIAASLCGLVGYLAIGHSWNVAASNIDDAAGRMDGYTAIVFKGTVDPEETAKSGSGAKSGQQGTADPDALDKAADEAEAGLSGLEAPGATSDDFDGKESADSPAQRNAGSGKDESAASGSGSEKHAQNGSAAAKQGETAADDDEPGPDVPSSDANPSGNGSTSSSSPSAKKKTPIDIEEVEQSYLDKNATVFSIDSENPGRYREGTILKKGDHRFGVFSVAPRMTTKMIEKQIEYFEEYEVDFIVVLTPDKKIVEEVAGIDIVISTQDEGLFVMGETINGTFYVNAPQLGSAGIILISPSNVVSAKVVQPS